MTYSPDINTEVVKDFLRSVYKAKTAEIKRKKHREKISGHIKRAKKTALSKKVDKEKIEKEFERLEKNFNEALEREKHILEEQKHGSKIVNELRNRLEKLERKLSDERSKHESLDQIKLALQRIHEEVKVRKVKRKKKKKREKELEQKISKRS